MDCTWNYDRNGFSMVRNPKNNANYYQYTEGDCKFYYNILLLLRLRSYYIFTSHNFIVWYNTIDYLYVIFFVNKPASSNDCLFVRRRFLYYYSYKKSVTGQKQIRDRRSKKSRVVTSDYILYYIFTLKVILLFYYESMCFLCLIHTLPRVF